MEVKNFHPSFLSNTAKLLGEESKDFLESLQMKPPVSIRRNPWKQIDIQGLDSVKWSKEGFYLETRPAFVDDPAFFQGRFYVQEASSMIIGKIAECLNYQKPIHRALDLCSAPGGKSTDLISSLPDLQMLVSNEIVGKRVIPLKENIIKWGKNNSVITHTNPQAFSKLDQEFDLLVVDAPCSGEGMFRKDPKALDQWSPGLVSKCVDVQKEILSSAWSSLKVGGYLIYSTCTLNDKENEGVTNWLAEQVEAENHPISELREIDLFESNSPVSGISTYRFLPNRTRGEGFTFSIIRKAGKQNPFKLERMKKRPAQLPWKLKRIQQKPSILNQKLELENVCENGDDLYSASKEIIEFTNSFAEDLNIQYGGRYLGQNSRSGFLPSHDLAMMAAFDFQPSSELSKEESLEFLRRHPLPRQEDQNGWRLAKYEGLPLGWSKYHKGHLKSHYPQEYRIRKD